MEEFFDKLNKAIIFFSSLDYLKIFKNIGGVFSFSIVHFVGFVYFSTGTVPPVVDVVSFANLTFSVAAYYAVSGVVGKALSVFLLRAVIAYISPLFLQRRVSRHSKLRSARRVYNNFSAENLRKKDPDSFARRHNRVKILLNKAMEYPEVEYGVHVRYAVTFSVFLVLFVGVVNSVIFLAATLLYAACLFLAYSAIFLVFESAQKAFVVNISRNEGVFMSVVGVVSNIHIIYAEIVGEFYVGAAKFLKSFVAANAVLMAIVGALTLGAARAAHVLDTSAYSVNFSRGDELVEYERFYIFSTNANGILGLDDIGGNFLFIPYDSGIVARYYSDYNGDYYSSRLAHFLFDDFWGYDKFVQKSVSAWGK